MTVASLLPANIHNLGDDDEIILDDYNEDMMTWKRMVLLVVSFNGP